MRTECSNISKHLWVGSEPDLSSPIEGIDVVVLCAREIQPAATGFTGRILRCPLPDCELHQQELSLAMLIAREIARDVHAGKRVLVTCAAGRNRSALVAALALGHLTRASADQLVALIRARRRQDCLTNEHFVAYLRRFVGDGRRR